MARLKRIVAEGYAYHVVTTTRDRAPLFRDPANARILEQAVQFIRTERAYVGAYVIMPDHLHVLVKPRDGYTISRVMQSIKGYAARAINARTRARGPLWQASFFDRMLEGQRQALDTIAYIHDNPVVAGLADEPDAYPFSSARSAALVDLEEFA